MALYAGIQIVAGDKMKVEFQTPGRTQVMGVVRSKAGCCFGVEFTAPLADEQRKTPAAATPAVSAARSHSELWVLLRRKEQEIQRLRSEIDILHSLTRRERR